MSTEIWKPIPGFPDYEVSNMGQIKSLKFGKVNILRTSFGRSRYPRVTLLVNRSMKQYSVHRLVMLAFVGPCPEGMEVCHRDDDPNNNRLDNLRYDTHAANAQERKPGRHQRKAGRTMDEVIQLRVSSRQYDSLERLAKEQDRTVAYIVRKMVNNELDRILNTPDPALAEYEHIMGRKFEVTNAR